MKPPKRIITGPCGYELNLTQRTVFGIDYLVGKESIIQLKDSIGRIKVGVMADFHGDYETTRRLAKILSLEGVDAILMLGDLVNAFGPLKNLVSEVDETKRILSSVLDNSTVPVLVIPGNHDRRQSYSLATGELSLQYSHLFDLDVRPIMQLSDLTIVGLGGVINERACVEGGFIRGTSPFKNLGTLATKYERTVPTLFMTHMPQLYRTENGLDYNEEIALNDGNTTLMLTRKAVNSKFAVSGHFHRNARVIGKDEILLDRGEWSEYLDLNPGSVYNKSIVDTVSDLVPSVGVLEFKGYFARASILR